MNNSLCTLLLQNVSITMHSIGGGGKMSQWTLKKVDVVLYASNLLPLSGWG